MICFGKKYKRKIERSFEEVSVNTEPIKYRAIRKFYPNPSQLQIEEKMSDEQLPYAPSINSLCLEDDDLSAEDIDNCTRSLQTPKDDSFYQSAKDNTNDNSTGLSYRTSVILELYPEAEKIDTPTKETKSLDKDISASYKTCEGDTKPIEDEVSRRQPSTPRKIVKISEDYTGKTPLQKSPYEERKVKSPSPAPQPIDSEISELFSDPSVEKFEEEIQQKKQSTFKDPQKARQEDSIYSFVNTTELDSPLKLTEESIDDIKISEREKSIAEQKVPEIRKEEGHISPDVMKISENVRSIIPTGTGKITVKNEELLAHDLWALTKIHFNGDGSKVFEIIEVSPVPPGQYIFQHPNKFSVFGVQPKSD